MLDDSKQDTATTTEHIKILIIMLKEKNVLTASLIIIWWNNYGSAEQYRCPFTIYLMSVMSKYHSVIIDWGISAPEHEKKVVDGLNAIDKRYIYQ